MGKGADVSRVTSETQLVWSCEVACPCLDWTWEVQTSLQVGVMLSVPLLCSAIQELRWCCSLPLHTCFAVLRLTRAGHLTKLCVCSFTSILSRLHMRKAISLLAVDEVGPGPFAEALQQAEACLPASVKAAVPW